MVLDIYRRHVPGIFLGFVVMALLAMEPHPNRRGIGSSG